MHPLIEICHIVKNIGYYIINFNCIFISILNLLSNDRVEGRISVSAKENVTLMSVNRRRVGGRRGSQHLAGDQQAAVAGSRGRGQHAETEAPAGFCGSPLALICWGNKYLSPGNWKNMLPWRLDVKCRLNVENTSHMAVIIICFCYYYHYYYY